MKIKTVCISDILTICLFAIVLLFWTACSEAESAKKPNIIFILADDLGYQDLAYSGSKMVETPRLDKLTESGIKFNNFYSASAVCSPTRASSLTGKYPIRFGIMSAFRDREEHLPSSELTIPKILKEAGYVSAHVGKWHLGGLNVKHCENRSVSIPGPLQHGFDQYLAMYEDPAIRAPLLWERRLYREGARHLVKNDKKYPPIDKHWTDVKVDEALSFIEKSNQDGNPFYLNFWFDLPHTPYEPSVDYIQPYCDRANGDDLLYRSMIAHMDASVGRIVDKVMELGISENTLIVFTSDNGPSHMGSAGPLKGRKGDLHEGGIHQVATAVWPGKIEPGSQSDELLSTIDLLPTFCAAAGVDLPAEVKIDGLNALQTIINGEPMPERTMFWNLDVFHHFFGVVMDEKPLPYASDIVRKGKWKLFAVNGDPVALVNLEEDPYEEWNLLEAWPEITADLTSELNEWRKENNVPQAKEIRVNPYHHKIVLDSEICD